ncbi:type I CRISPR-associated protein Cas7 [Priestia megaterium]|uniref:type I CRISPR-associated protein Cas7 n=1 Tax=Priestia megaterium TaxID=1404 RepID=UPI002E206C85|nr:type I CRISPR-associated protein Cas7 [Priestia megaterium]MED4284806.1 type I CRISPR-associated protein Cas7 [Priestia megaterium]
MKNNRVSGVVGIGAYRSNFNAGFDSKPKKLPDGTIFASDVAIKRSMRDALSEMGEPVFYKKTMAYDEKKGNSKVVTIEERYANMFGDEVKDRLKVLKQLMTATDVRMFGVLYTGKTSNIGYRGTVQFAQGLNVDKETEEVKMDITAPFSSNEKESSTIGKKHFTDEAHYLYNFVIDPAENRQYIQNGWLDEEEVFSERDYEAFKDAAKVCATRINTAAKVACFNEFALFVELKEDSKKYLIDLANLIKVTRGEDKTKYDLNELMRSLIDSPVVTDIEKVEIYAETNKVELIGLQMEAPFDIHVKSIFE